MEGNRLRDSFTLRRSNFPRKSAGIVASQAKRNLLLTTLRHAAAIDCRVVPAFAFLPQSWRTLVFMTRYSKHVAGEHLPYIRFPDHAAPSMRASETSIPTQINAALGRRFYRTVLAVSLLAAVSYLRVSSFTDHSTHRDPVLASRSLELRDEVRERHGTKTQLSDKV